MGLSEVSAIFCSSILLIDYWYSVGEQSLDPSLQTTILYLPTNWLILLKTSLLIASIPSTFFFPLNRDQRFLIACMLYLEYHILCSNAAIVLVSNSQRLLYLKNVRRVLWKSPGPIPHLKWDTHQYQTTSPTGFQDLKNWSITRKKVL